MRLSTADVLVIVLFFLVMLAIGAWSHFKNKNTADYYVASGKIPWWLAGISHHISGYSGAVFVAYAGLAYTHGFSIYIWWAFAIAVAILISAKIFPVYWVRLRKKFQIQSPLEFLSIRYNTLTQQIMAWSGVLLKVFDVGAKWAAIAILLNVIVGIPMAAGILVSGIISLLYITFGGLLAIMATDFIQFVVQIAAGIIMFVVVVARLGGISSVTGIWHELPANNGHLFNDPYTFGFALAFLFINLLSFNGGSWGLATRYISSPNERQASKAAYLSGILFLVWPLVLFFPMWAAPIILPGLEDPTRSYGLLMLKLLPSGLVGLVTASLFAATMSMVASDINTLSAVIARDILPVISKRFNKEHTSLATARTTTFVYTVLTIIIASQYERFGGVIGLIVSWYGALVGPIAVPLLLGMLPAFRTCGPKAAIFSIAGGLLAFVFTKSILEVSLTLNVGLPVMISAIIYFALGWLDRNKKVPTRVDNLLEDLKPH